MLQGDFYDGHENEPTSGVERPADPLHFSPETPLPIALARKLVKTRIREAQG